MRARDKRTPTENVRCWRFILLEKTQNNLKGGGGGGGGNHPHPLVRSRVNIPLYYIFSFFKGLGKKSMIASLQKSPQLLTKTIMW